MSLTFTRSDYQEPKQVNALVSMNPLFVNGLLDDRYILVSVNGQLFFQRASEEWEYAGCAGCPNNFFLTEENIDSPKPPVY